MGYVSNVLLAIAGPKNELTAFLTAASLEASTARVFDDFKHDIKKGKYGRLDVFTIQGAWKHYSNYDEIIALNLLWNHAEDGWGEKLYGAYIILGEDINDNTMKYFGLSDVQYELASINRDIEQNIDYDWSEII